jgi:hypothetical protein
VYIECAKRDKLIVVDYQDAVRLCNIRFYENNNHIKTKRSNFHIAYLILEPEAGYDSHHINDDTYDNRRNNLMVKSHKGHAHLTHKKGDGVKRHRRKWSVRVCHGRLGATAITFENRAEAVRFVDWSNYVRFGNEAILNSPGHICSGLAAHMIMESGGEYFTVTFIKRTTVELRSMTAKMTTDTVMTNNLLFVEQREDSTLRTIPIEGIKELTIGGKNFIVSQE